MEVMTTVCVKMLEKMKKGFQKLEDSDDDKSEAEEREILPLRITYLPPFLIEEAKNILNETEENRQKNLAELRRMIEAEPNLSSPTDDLFLFAFLRSRKFNVKKAFKLLQNYWMFRKEYNTIYDFAEIEPVQSLIMRSFMGLLEYRDVNGCCVFIVKVGLWDPDKDSYEDVFRAVSAILIYSLEHEATQIAGFRMIFDIRGLTWTQLKYLTPANIMLLVKSTQFCFPARYKGIHILGESKIFNFIWSLIYPFLTSKLKKKIFFHGEDLTPLMEFIHPSVLPEEFGGKALKFDNADWSDIIHTHVDSVMRLLNFGYKD